MDNLAVHSHWLLCNPLTIPTDFVFPCPTNAQVSCRPRLDSNPGCPSALLLRWPRSSKVSERRALRLLVLLPQYHEALEHVGLAHPSTLLLSGHKIRLELHLQYLLFYTVKRMWERNLQMTYCKPRISSRQILPTLSSCKLDKPDKYRCQISAKKALLKSDVFVADLEVSVGVSGQVGSITGAGTLMSVIVE